MTGYSSAQCVVMYEQRCRKLQPDLVLLNVGPNDASGVVGLTDEQRMAWGRRKGLRTLDDALSNLDCYRALSRLVPEPNPQEAPEDISHVARASKKVFVKNILKLNNLCNTDGCPLVLIWFAYCPEIATKNLRDQSLSGDPIAYAVRILSYREAMEMAAKIQGIPDLSLPILTTSPDRDLFFDSVHPNEGGHFLQALALEQFLTNEDLLPRAGRPVPATRSDITRQFIQDCGHVLDSHPPAAPTAPPDDDSPQ